MATKIVIAVGFFLASLFLLMGVGGHWEKNADGQWGAVGYKAIRMGCGGLCFLIFVCVGGSVLVSYWSSH